MTFKLFISYISEDELALYDLPAQLEYIYGRTKQNGQIIYISYSLGTTVGLMYSVTFPERARTILKLIVMLGPSGKLTNTKSPLLRYFNPVFMPIMVNVFV